MLFTICVYQTILFYNLRPIQAAQAEQLVKMATMDAVLTERIADHEKWWEFMLGDHFERFQAETKTKNKLWPIPVRRKTKK